MTYEEFNAICDALPATSHVIQWGDSHVWKVDTKVFAVGGWVKGLFEAMVGVPLWALAHIRIDGQGLAGDAALNGYFLIFEIFIHLLMFFFKFKYSFFSMTKKVTIALVFNDIYHQHL